MPLLGFDAPKKAIDELFNLWDPDGSGDISFDELKKILSARPKAAPTPAKKGSGKK